MKRLINAGYTVCSFALILVMASSCEQEFNTIGADVIGGGDFNVERVVIDDIFLTNTKLGPVRSNFLPLYQLGTREDATFGRRTASVAAQLRLINPNGGTNYNPTFGNFTPDVEATNDADDDPLTLNDNERVVNAYLDIPFYSRLVSTDENSESIYELDSLFGNRDATFDLKVEELTFFLRGLDPDNNFQQVQQYYTSTEGVDNPTPNFADFTDTILFEGQTSVSDEEIDVVNAQPDAEGNPVVDERLSPRIRVPLDSLFIQERILNAEGTSVLSTDSEFTDYLRGLHITTSNFSDDLYMLLDFGSANIRIEYEFDEVDTNNTVNDPSDDTIVVDQDTFLIPLNGNVVNILDDGPLPTTVAQSLANTEAPERLYIRGGQGIMTEVKLFDQAGSSAVLDQIKANNWLINQANLIFHVDKAATNGETLPLRVYLYDLENETALLDYLTDPTGSAAASEINRSRSVYGGILDETDADNPFYSISITSHLSDIIRRDSTNVTLGLSLTSDIRNINIARPLDEGDISTPEASVISPFGVVLYGNNLAVPEDKRTTLEVFFSEVD